MYAAAFLPIADITCQEAHSAVFRQFRGERREERVEVGPRLLRAGDRVRPFHVVPQGIGVENEPGPGHDVGPVAGFVLLQQPDLLVLLAQKPTERGVDPPAEPLLDAILGKVPRPERDGCEPPEGRVDAPEVPEVGLPAFRGDEIRDLPVLRLVAREEFQPGHRAFPERRSPETAIPIAEIDASLQNTRV